MIFNTKFTQSEDKWVAFEADSIGSHNFGFIYIDPQSGLTFDYAGTFKIDNNGKFILKKKELEGSMKVRLEPNNRLVAIISPLPEEFFSNVALCEVS